MKENILTEIITSPELPSPQTDDRRYRMLGWGILAIFVGIFGIWSFFAPLESAVPAPGKVIVASNNRIIQHLEGGIVKSILVKDGQKVKKGDSVILLDDTQASAQLKMIEAQYYDAIALESRLIAERDKAGGISFSPELDHADKTQRSLAMDSQKREFEGRKRFLEGEKKVLEQRIEQLKNQIEGYQSIIQSKSSLAESYRQEVKEWEALFAQQLIDKIRLRDAKRQLLMTEGEISNAKSEIARSKAQISEFKAQIISQDQNFMKDVLAQLSDVQTKISDMRARIDALRDTVERTVIKTPVDGTVMNLSIHTVGGVIPAGKPILEIVPEGEPLIIEGKIAATDIINIHVGLKADIQFPSFAHVKTLKEVKGEVMTIGADTVADEATHMLYYPVKIKITADGANELRRNHLTLQPGIPADAMIVVASRTFADYLIHPFKVMFKKSFNEQ